MKKKLNRVCANCRLFSNRLESWSGERYDGICKWGLYGELIKDKNKHTCSQWSRIPK